MVRSRILLHEEDPVIEADLCAILSNSGYEVNLTKSDEIVVSLFNEGLPEDLLVVTNPLIFNRMERLRNSNEELDSKPFLAITSLRPIDLEKIINLPESHVLRKPFVPFQLFEKIRNLLNTN